MRNPWLCSWIGIKMTERAGLSLRMRTCVPAKVRAEDSLKLFRAASDWGPRAHSTWLLSLNCFTFLLESTVRVAQLLPASSSISWNNPKYYYSLLFKGLCKLLSLQRLHRSKESASGFPITKSKYVLIRIKGKIKLEYSIYMWTFRYSLIVGMFKTFFSIIVWKSLLCKLARVSGAVIEWVWNFPS